MSYRALKLSSPQNCCSSVTKENISRAALELPQIQAVFSLRASEHSEYNHPPFALDWYIPWVRAHLEDSGPDILRCLIQSDSDQRTPGEHAFENLWTKIAMLIRNGNTLGIDNLVHALSEDGVLCTSGSDEPHNRLNSARGLVFAVIGWQTMLYTPDFGSCDSSQLAILDDMEGYQSISRLAWRQSQNHCKRPLLDFLLGFGVLMPTQKLSYGDSSDARKTLGQYKHLESISFNAFLLVSVAGITINWVDSLSCHLDFDEAAKIVHLFRFPSFCAACMVGVVGDSTSEDYKSVLHACSQRQRRITQWATTEEVDQMLSEILLSYRVLFGQCKQSRNLFRKLIPLSDGTQDPLLADFCGRKQSHFPIGHEERAAYELARDFPIFKSKLARLQHFTSQCKPRSWKQLWRDKRDSAGWFTFWAVILIGGLGVLLAFVQVILQILQLAIKS